MNKKKTLIHLMQRDMEINARIDAIADVCEEEKRDRNDAEEAEYRALIREKEINKMRAQAFNSAEERTMPADFGTQLRTALIDKGLPVKIQLRSALTTSSVADTGLIEVAQQEMINPLREALVYEAVNIKVPVGLPGTKLRWPKHTAAVAEWEDEGGALTDKSIDFSALSTKPVRLGIAIPVTKELLESSEGEVERVIREEMPAAVASAVNKALLATTTTDGSKAPVGPFVEAAKTAVEFAGAVPTRKELLSMFAKVTGAGIKLISPLFVMTEATKAELMETKVDAGSGRFVCENGCIFGYPVFTYAGFPEGAVGFGDWSYQPGGFFGPMTIMADPYTLARKNSVDFVLNTHFATATLRPEAFVYGAPTAKTTGSTGSTGHNG